MRAILLLILAFLIASGFGRRLLWRLDPALFRPLERTVYATALGLGLAAYGVFLLGVLGWLSFWPVTIWWGIMGLIGLPGVMSNFQDWSAIGRSALASLRNYKLRFSPGALFTAFAVLALCILGGIALLSCFKPPGALEWDVLSYHLADPKIFLADHRITSLRTEHHSNFPFTMEMLFTVGLLYDGYALANLFHFLMAGLITLAIMAFCRKFLSPLAGWSAVLLFASTPVILWEAGVAYIDLGLALYVTLATFAVIQAFHSPQSSAGTQSPAGEEGHSQKQWVLLAGIMMGFALGMKYLSLVPFGLLALLLFVRLRSLRLLGTYAAIALVIASPWYLKNIVITHNPVYPFFYKIFSQSRDWSADRAKSYETEQNRFGDPHSLSDPGETVRNMLSAPWRLLAASGNYSNGGEYTFMTLIGGLYAGLNLTLVFRRRVPPMVVDLLWIGIAQFIAWFMLAQVGRYVIPFLPLFAVTAGYAATAPWKRLEPDPSRVSDPLGGTALWGAPLLLIVGQTGLTLWAVFALPTIRHQSNEISTALSVPEIITTLTQPDGVEGVLTRHMETYSSIQWLNKNTPPDAGVVLYDDVRGFYLDRPYLWGDGEHSAYIPYDQFSNGQQLTDWMLQHHLRYALFNMQYNRHWQTTPQLRDPELPYGPAGNEVLALQRWYEDVSPKEEPHWRVIVGDALHRKLWETEFVKNGVAVLRIGGESQDSGKGNLGLALDMTWRVQP